MRRLVLAGASVAMAFAQGSLPFETASVQVASGPRPPRSTITGGPGTVDPNRITYSWVSMRALLEHAFGIKSDRILGLPQWVDQDKFTILARVGPTATKEQVPEMMVNLMEERFHLEFHRTKKEIDSYTMIVAAGGPTLKAAAAPSGPPPRAPRPDLQAPLTLDRDGFPEVPAGYKSFQQSTTSGVTRMTFRMSSPADLVSGLSRGAIPMTDATGLSGPYDFQLEFDAESLAALAGGPSASKGGNPAPDIFRALEKQLGLKLEKGKILADFVAIDNLDRKPTGK